jgi:hypothetical protein
MQRSTIQGWHNHNDYRDIKLCISIVTCMSDYRRGCGLDIEFIDSLQVVSTNNYIVISTL